MKDTPREQVIAYLRDAHSIEEQALGPLRMAPSIAGDEQLAGLFRDHLAETERHERLVRERLEANQAGTSTTKDVVMAIGGKGFVLFARLQPDTPGKLVTHAYSYEHLERAAYALLAEVAGAAGDAETESAARRIEAEEQRMAERLERHITDSLDASIGDLSADQLEGKLTSSLADAHALETQSITLLGRAPKIVDDPTLAALFESHRLESERHRNLLEGRLQAHDANPSRLKDAALRLGGLNWTLFFQAQPDTPGKLTAFTYAVEHLEIAGYGHLRGVAERVGDAETMRVIDEIVAQERASAAALEAQFAHAASISLQGVQAPG